MCDDAGIGCLVTPDEAPVQREIVRTAWLARYLFERCKGRLARRPGATVRPGCDFRGKLRLLIEAAGRRLAAQSAAMRYTHAQRRLMGSGVPEPLRRHSVVCLVTKPLWQGGRRRDRRCLGDRWLITTLVGPSVRMPRGATSASLPGRSKRMRGSAAPH